MRWVWDANRNDPVRENATLTIGEDGNFVLADVDGRVVWQTNTANKGVTGIRLLPNGNLVLYDKNGKFVWQSFDHPTDTLLVGQSVRIDGRNKLVSRTSDVDGSDGPYSIVLDCTTSTAGNSRRLLQVRPIGGGNTYNLNKLNYNATISFLRLGSDGNLRLSPPMTKECALPSKCGAFGLCDKRMCVACTSPRGLLGWSESCKPPKPVPCRSGAKADYYKIVGVEHFLNTYLDDGEGPMKVEQCRDKCTKDCKCLGFIYKEDTSKCLTAPLLGTLIKDVNATSVGYIKYSK
ncbi:epidermis-specific secreted glycoprotein EP1-like [Hibiscus syriacus]|uniref:Epidermis-specific secreted glycoprotein EP1-like n=1 Tax=Hibiscus syriacus TaxID=106335 RepID=A0A6A2YP35_HIBSY|nr:epidermis-specific secreted glycoprotein EP1-like [Hibiscus syriacus]